MKKKMCVILLAVLLLTSLNALAFDWNQQNVSPGTAYQTSGIEKTGNTGSDAGVIIIAQTSQWIYRIRKASDGVFVSNQLRFPTSTGTYSLPYNDDGYGNSLGRHGYFYKLNVAYYSQASGSGTSMGIFIP